MIRLGMGAKFSLAVALLILVFAGFFAIYFPSQQEHVARVALERRGFSVANALAPVLALEVHDPSDPGATEKKLTDHFESIAAADADIGYVLIVRQDRRPFARYAAAGVTDADVGDPPPTLEPRVDERDGFVQVSVPIRHAREHVGTLVVGLRERAVRDARRSSQVSALVVSAIIFLVGVVVAWLVGRGISTPLLHAADELNKVSATLASAARAQETSSAEEAAAVAQTRRSMETLLNSAQQIADRSSEVLGNAERSTNGSRQIAERIGNLNELAERITEILATIMQVADKADLLALNASLEGTRAGEAGKGFALVAAEMRRLAENVMESVTGIRALMQEMREASQAAVAASQEGTRSSTATTHSAREIALLTQEQRQATEQVIASMDEMGKILAHTLESIQRTTRSAGQLTTLAGTLSEAVRPHPKEGEGEADEGAGRPHDERHDDPDDDTRDHDDEPRAGAA